MQATYPRSRRSVYSLAQPTVETRGRGQAHLRLSQALPAHFPGDSG